MNPVHNIMSITRNQAIYMLFCEEYSDENAAILAKKIEQLGNFDVCYENSPNKPVLVHLYVIRNDPFTFKRYLTSCPEPDTNEVENTKFELGKTNRCFYSTLTKLLF